MSTVENPIKIPTEDKVKQLFELLEDDAFRFPTIKLDKDTKKYKIPAPTKEDKDNIEFTARWYGVIIAHRKNNYQSKEDKEAGKEPSDKRELYILPVGKIKPVKMYISPSGIRNWNTFRNDAMKNFEKPFCGVLCEFTGEAASNAEYKWAKPVLKIARVLTEDEIEYIMKLRPKVDEAVKSFTSIDENALEDMEDAMLGIKKPSTKTDELSDEDMVNHKTVDLEDDSNDAKPATGKAGAKGGKTDAGKPKEEPKADPKPETPATGYPSLDDGEEDLTPPAKAGQGTSALDIDEE